MARDGGRRPVRRVVRRPSLLAELTDDVEPDPPTSLARRFLALLLLLLAVVALASGVAFIIVNALQRQV